jgi:hypothetical protein
MNDKFASSFTNFIKSILQSAEHNIAIFFSKGNDAALAASQTVERSKLMRTYSFSDMRRDILPIPVTKKSHHIFLPYFGGIDDILALKIVLQLCEKSDVTATVVHFVISADGSSKTPDPYFAAASTSAPTKIASRVRFETVTVSNAVESVLERAASEIQPDSRGTTWLNLIVLGRRAGLKPVGGSMSQKVAEEIRECLGVLAGHITTSDVMADLLVVQARPSVVQD